MEDLTRVEERIMQILWKIKSGFVKDVLEQITDDPKPPYNTISSVVRILAKKGYLHFKAYGKTYEYYPAISKHEYRNRQLRKMISGYFGDSPASLLSFIVKEENLSKKEIDELKNMIDKIDPDPS